MNTMPEARCHKGLFWACQRSLSPCSLRCFRSQPSTVRSHLQTFRSQDTAKSQVLCGSLGPTASLAMLCIRTRLSTWIHVRLGQLSLPVWSSNCLWGLSVNRDSRMVTPVDPWSNGQWYKPYKSLCVRILRSLRIDCGLGTDITSLVNDRNTYKPVRPTRGAMVKTGGKALDQDVAAWRLFTGLRSTMTRRGPSRYNSWILEALVRAVVV